MPKLLVFAGPNGSGKSTITSGISLFGEYVNADLIKKHLQCSDEEAAVIAEKTREYFLASNMDFTFETVLSTPRNINLMERAKEKGYYIVCMYVLTVNPQINIARVRQRVASGGHDVPTEKISTRYCRALKLIPNIFPLCDELYVFDNSLDSGEDGASMIIRSVKGNVEMYPNKVWNKAMIECLVTGTYPDRYIP